MRRMKSAILLMGFVTVGNAQTRFYNDPLEVKLITGDIPNYWRMYDKLSSAKSTEDSISVIQTEYLDNASNGLKELMVKESYAFTSYRLLSVLKAYPKYIFSIKSSSLEINEYKQKIYSSFQRLKKLYPAAKFPDFYFAFGVFASGGTSVPSGMFIGAEIETAAPDSPRDELPDFLKAGIKTVDKIHFICSHEIIHFQQKGHPKNLLETSIHEGACDFIGELISGGLINEAQHAYGNQNEKKLWEEFKASMHGKDFSKWLYNGGSVKDRPADLGYFIGYRICKAYYDKQRNKTQALADILSIPDADLFLKKSGYH